MPGNRFGTLLIFLVLVVGFLLITSSRDRPEETPAVQPTKPHILAPAVSVPGDAAILRRPATDETSRRDREQSNQTSQTTPARQDDGNTFGIAPLTFLYEEVGLTAEERRIRDMLDAGLSESNLALFVDTLAEELANFRSETEVLRPGGWEDDLIAFEHPGSTKVSVFRQNNAPAYVAARDRLAAARLHESQLQVIDTYLGEVENEYQEFLSSSCRRVLEADRDLSAANVPMCNGRLPQVP